MGIKTDLNNLFDGRHLLPFEPEDPAERRPILAVTLENSTGFVQPPEQPAASLHGLVATPFDSTQSKTDLLVTVDGNNDIVSAEQTLFSTGGNIYWRRQADSKTVAWEVNGNVGFQLIPTPNQIEITPYEYEHTFTSEGALVKFYLPDMKTASKVYVDGTLFTAPSDVLGAAAIGDDALVIVGTNAQGNDRVYSRSLSNTSAGWTNHGNINFPDSASLKICYRCSVWSFSDDGKSIIGAAYAIDTTISGLNNIDSGHYLKLVIARVSLNTDGSIASQTFEITDASWVLGSQSVVNVGAQVSPTQSTPHEFSYDQDTTNSFSSTMDRVIAVGFNGNTESISRYYASYSWQQISDLSNSSTQAENGTAGSSSAHYHVTGTFTISSSININSSTISGGYLDQNSSVNVIGSDYDTFHHTKSISQKLIEPVFIDLINGCCIYHQRDNINGNVSDYVKSWSVNSGEYDSTSLYSSSSNYITSWTTSNTTWRNSIQSVSYSLTEDFYVKLDNAVTQQSVPHCINSNNNFLRIFGNALPNGLFLGVVEDNIAPSIWDDQSVRTLFNESFTKLSLSNDASRSFSDDFFVI